MCGRGWGPEKEESCVWGQSPHREGRRLCLSPSHTLPGSLHVAPAAPHRTGAGARGQPSWSHALPRSFLHQPPAPLPARGPGASVFPPGQWAAVRTLKEEPHSVVGPSGLRSRLPHPVPPSSWVRGAPRPKGPRWPPQQASPRSTQALARVGSLPSLSAHCPQGPAPPPHPYPHGREEELEGGAGQGQTC